MIVENLMKQSSNIVWAGNLSPEYSVDSSVYGLPGASAAVPEQCEIVQAHYYYRHGARYVPLSSKSGGDSDAEDPR